MCCPNKVTVSDASLWLQQGRGPELTWQVPSTCRRRGAGWASPAHAWRAAPGVPVATAPPPAGRWPRAAAGPARPAPLTRAGSRLSRSACWQLISWQDTDTQSFSERVSNQEHLVLPKTLSSGVSSHGRETWNTSHTVSDQVCTWIPPVQLPQFRARRQAAGRYVTYGNLLTQQWTKLQN